MKEVGKAIAVLLFCVLVVGLASSQRCIDVIRTIMVYLLTSLAIAWILIALGEWATGR